jgi:hypothetical protein
VISKGLLANAMLAQDPKQADKRNASLSHAALKRWKQLRKTSKHQVD